MPDGLQITEAVIAEFAERRPRFHPEGSPDWCLSAKAMRFIGEHLAPYAVTLETGAGLSTVLFAAHGGRHFCVSLDEGQSELILGYCAEMGIDAGRVEFHTGLSQDILPALETPPLDLVLIDGGHGFPAPFIDWGYTAGRLKIGGVLVIDDVALWTCGALVDFLKADSAWTDLGRIGRDGHAFRKSTAVAPQEFVFQPYVLRKSRPKQMIAKILRAWDLLTAGGFGNRQA